MNGFQVSKRLIIPLFPYRISSAVPITDGIAVAPGNEVVSDNNIYGTKTNIQPITAIKEEYRSSLSRIIDFFTTKGDAAIASNEPVNNSHALNCKRKKASPAFPNDITCIAPYRDNPAMMVKTKNKKLRRTFQIITQRSGINR